MSPALWWSLWVLAFLVGIGAGAVLVRFVAAEVLADRARARRGVQLAGSVAFSRKREERPADVEEEPAGAVVLPFLPREGFAPAEPVQVTDERFPALVAVIREERARLARLREELAPRTAVWPAARRADGRPALVSITSEEK